MKSHHFVKTGKILIMIFLVVMVFCTPAFLRQRVLHGSKIHTVDYSNGDMPCPPPGKSVEFLIHSVFQNTNWGEKNSAIIENLETGGLIRVTNIEECKVGDDGKILVISTSREKSTSYKVLPKDESATALEKHLVDLTL